MNDVIDVQARFRNDNDAPNNDTPPNPKKMDTLKLLGWISYGLHFIVALAVVVPGVQAGLGLLLIAILLDLVKKSDAVGTWQHSHFSWRIRSVIWAGVLCLLTSWLWLLLFVPGMIAWGIISIWFLYRIIRGMVCMSEDRPVGV